MAKSVLARRNALAYLSIIELRCRCKLLLSVILYGFDVIPLTD